MDLTNALRVSTSIGTAYGYDDTICRIAVVVSSVSSINFSARILLFVGGLEGLKSAGNFYMESGHGVIEEVRPNGKVWDKWDTG